MKTAVVRIKNAADDFELEAIGGLIAQFEAVVNVDQNYKFTVDKEVPGWNFVITITDVGGGDIDVGDSYDIVEHIKVLDDQLAGIQSDILIDWEMSRHSEI